MSTVFWVVIAFAIVVLALFVMNKSLVQGLFHLARTKLGLAGDKVKQVDPAAQMKQAALDGMANLKTADQALIQCRQLRAQLERQREADLSQAKRLRATVDGMIGKVSDTDPNLVEKLRRIKDLEASADKCREQLESNEAIYQATLKQANNAAKQMKSAMAEADRMKVNLKLGEQMNNLQAMLNQYDPSSMNSSLAKIDEYRSIAQSQMDKHDATAKVMADRAQALGVMDDEPDDASDVSDLLASMKAKKQGDTPKE